VTGGIGDTGDTSDTLLRLRDEHVFDPAPRQAELFRFHVPFDQLTRGTGCEHTLDAALRRGEQVALIGSSGSGKSSVISFVLGPLVEDLAPLPIPVSLEDEAVATSPVAFSAHLVRTVARYIAYAQPADEDDARRILRRTTPTQPSARRRPTKVSIAPSWMGVRLELAAELDSATAPPAPRSGQEVIEQARRILELISARELLPVLVFDDTDKWLQVSSPADSARLVDGFFGRVVRLLAEELPAAAVIAVHEQYVTQPGYRSAEGFIESSVHVPPVPDVAGLAQILAQRVADLTEQPLADLITPTALRLLMRHYLRGRSGDLRRRVMYVAHTALARACDDAAATISERHMRLAISECAPNG
jgi:energy-coupling factor transporter ATP-binding protein EcfA2